ncbi:hypothetical protein PHMEG_00036288 [Phytophthora megakarya]|uniref:Uncharacterized protein n=1 Tax=Phytophthora megakarya TaxID=4795 RepID=A0A225ULS3_9STRA|nr:hypothetical protein PHMEG_00036288 [Phytophthora megakarya]
MCAAKRIPVSSPVAVATVASTPAPAPASASTSVSTPVIDSASVPASAHVSAVTPISPSGTTEKNVSVDKYLELQEKKLELEAKQRAGAAKPDSPKTVFDGSSIFSADGGIPVDYEDGGLEDEVTSSSQSHESKPASGTRRPREDDSDASSSKRPRSASDAVPSRLEALAITSDRDATRTDDIVHEPWMPSESGIKERYGALIPPNEIPLYVDNRIVDDAEAAAKHFDNSTNQKRDYYISLFHELQYWSSKKTSGRSKVPEWQALCQSWNQFVTNFNNDPAGYRERISSARERFVKYSRVHEGSVNANIPCAVPEGVHCTHCPVGAPRISERDLTGYTTNRVPVNIKELRAKLVCTRQHPSVVTEHNTPRTTAPRSVTPPVRGGLRTPSPFPERPSSGRFGETTYLEGEPIVSNEYENEPDLGSSSGWCGQQSDPPRGGSYRGQSYASVGGAGRSSYGQPWVDHGLQALHARVEAVERIQVSEMPELRQELFLQKAYVAEAAQTTSNIRVEVLEQVRLLQEKVKRIEEKVRALRASSSTSHHG